MAVIRGRTEIDGNGQVFEVTVFPDGWRSTTGRFGTRSRELRAIPDLPEKSPPDAEPKLSKRAQVRARKRKRQANRPTHVKLAETALREQTEREARNRPLPRR